MEEKEEEEATAVEGFWAVAVKLAKEMVGLPRGVTTQAQVVVACWLNTLATEAVEEEAVTEAAAVKVLLALVAAQRPQNQQLDMC